MKSEVDKLNMNKMFNAPTSCNNLKTKVDHIDIGKLKTVPIDLTLNDAVDNNVVKNTKFNTLKNYSRCNYINTHKSIKHGKTNLETKIGDVYKKVPHTSRLVTTR